MRKFSWVDIAFFVLVVALLWPAGGDVFSPPAKVTAAVYVYEKDDTAVPSAVRAAFSTLNKGGIVATEFEEDTVDGSGEVPDQYKVPLAAAKATGLPALVVTAGDKVVRTVKDPKTAAQVLEAAK